MANSGPVYDSIVSDLAAFQVPATREVEPFYPVFGRHWNGDDAYIAQLAADVARRSGGKVNLERRDGSGVRGEAAYLRLTQNGRQLNLIFGPYSPPFQRDYNA